MGHLALVGAYLCSVLPTSTAAATVGTLFLLGTFYAATDGVVAALAGRLVPVQARTSGIAAAQTVVALARMCASAGFGLLWWLLGPGAAMITVGCPPRGGRARRGHADRPPRQCGGHAVSRS